MNLFAPTGTQTRIDNQDPKRFRAANRSPRQAVKYHPTCWQIGNKSAKQTLKRGDNVAPYRRSLTLFAILLALVFSSAADFTHNYVVLWDGLSLEPMKYLGRTV